MMHAFGELHRGTQRGDQMEAALEHVRTIALHRPTTFAMAADSDRAARS